MKRAGFGALLLTAAMVLQSCLPAFAADHSQSEQMKIQTQDETTVTATVPGTTASYYITMPSVLSLRNLDAAKDYRQEYEIGVHVDHMDSRALRITSDHTITYRNMEKEQVTLTGYNDFPAQYFTEDGSADGTLIVYAEDIAKVPQGTYSGDIHFYTSLVDSVPGGTQDPSPGGTDDPPPLITQKTVAAHVLMEENGQIKSNREYSMCRPFFYPEAELTLQDDGMVDVVMYLIDPIPGANFVSYGTPLQQFYVSGRASDLTRNGGEMDPNATITLHPGSDSYASAVEIDSGHQVDKYFEKDSNGGVFIDRAGTYPSSPVRFSVPLSAVRSSGDGTILMTAFVKPMSVWKQFFLVLDDVQDLGTAGGGGSSGGNGSGGGSSGGNSSGTNSGGNNGTVPGAGNGTDGNNSGTANGGNTQPGGSGSSDGADSGARRDGTYTCKVSMRKGTDINSVSMCNGLFYAKADMKVKGDSTTVTLYVIDPIPNYPNEGTPLKDIVFEANGKKYSASIDTGHQVSRYFPAASGFIQEAGNYNTSPITVTIPTSAAEASGKGKVVCSAYVNAVMKTTQSFYVVFSDWEGGETESSGEARAIDGSSESTPQSSAGGQASGSGSGTNTGSGSRKKAEDGSSSEKVLLEDDNVPSAAAPGAQSGSGGYEEGRAAGRKDYLLVTDAGSQGIWYLLLTAAAGAVYWHRKRRNL